MSNVKLALLPARAGAHRFTGAQADPANGDFTRLRDSTLRVSEMPACEPIAWNPIATAVQGSGADRLSVKRHR